MILRQRTEAMFTHYVFVYGTLKRGQHNHRLLAGRARYVATVQTAPAFTMRSLGGFPGVVRGGSTAISGEIYMVDDATLEDLDRLEGHPDFYERQKIQIGSVIVQAYILPEDFFDGREHRPVIQSGVWA